MIIYDYGGYIMFGKDGKFYDPRYDFDRDGKLNRKEFSMFIEDELEEDENDDIFSDSDFLETEEITEAEELLHAAGIESYEFEMLSGEEKYSLIRRNDWDVDLFTDYFGILERIELEKAYNGVDEDEQEECYVESEDGDYAIYDNYEAYNESAYEEDAEYYEDKVFSYFGIDIDTMRYGSEDARRSVLDRYNLRYDEFSDYFALFDIGEKWKNRTSNDLTLLSQILDEIGKYSSMKDRGITEWTNGDVVIKFTEDN